MMLLRPPPSSAAAVSPWAAGRVQVQSIVETIRWRIDRDMMRGPSVPVFPVASRVIDNGNASQSQKTIKPVVGCGPRLPAIVPAPDLTGVKRSACGAFCRGAFSSNNVVRHLIGRTRQAMRRGSARRGLVGQFLVDKTGVRRISKLVPEEIISQPNSPKIAQISRGLAHGRHMVNMP